MKNTKRQRQQLLKKLERINADLSLTEEFLSEHLEQNLVFKKEKIQFVKHLVVDLQQTIRFM